MAVYEYEGLFVGLEKSNQRFSSPAKVSFIIDGECRIGESITFPQAYLIFLIQISVSDVCAGPSSIGVILRIYLMVVVTWPSCVGDKEDQFCQDLIGINAAIVFGSRVIVNFLEGKDVG